MEIDPNILKQIQANVEAEAKTSEPHAPVEESEQMDIDRDEEMKYRLAHGFDRFGRTTVELSIIKVGDRIRADLGDITDLAESIRSKGLMQPIVLDDDDNLVAGGRRLTAFTTLLATNAVGDKGETFWQIPYVRFGSLTEAERTMLEIEENIRRKDMTWQERVLGIAKYHRIADLRNAVWSQEQTGKLLNVTQGYVSTALNVAKELSNKESPLWKLASINEAIKFLAMKNYDAAAIELNRRLAAKRAQAAPGTAMRNIIMPTTVILPGASQPISAGGPVTPAAEPVSGKKARITREEISGMFIHGNCLEQLVELRKITTINHIICDPPYAIEMSNLVQGNIDRVVDTHQVTQNKTMLVQFLQVAYDVIQPDGFLCMWYDLDQHQLLMESAERIGWRVQRWPFTWCKSSNCQNQSAHFNITKATEVCMFLRRSEQSTIKLKQSKNYLECSAVSSPTHPFIKPDAVWRYLIETVSTENQTIVDPFCGEGSMLLTGFKMNRQVVGVELDEAHIAHGVQWLYDELNGNTLDMIIDESQIPI